MLVVCPYCDCQSSDFEFCDQCNRELGRPDALQEVAPTTVVLSTGEVVDCSSWQQQWPRDPSAYFSAHIGNRDLRVHGIGPVDWKRLREQTQRRAQTAISVLAPIEIVEVADGAIVVAPSGMEVSMRILATIPQRFEGDWLVALDAAAAQLSRLGSALRSLHEADCVWLNFDPDALETTGEGVRITNLDVTLFRLQECPDCLRISPQFSPPEVCRFASKKIGRATDVYHLGALLYYWLAGLSPGFAGEGLDTFHHRFPPLRLFQPTLPPGINAVVARALSIEPAQRFATIDEFVTHFKCAIQEVRTRYRGSTTAKKDTKTSESALWNFLGRLFGRQKMRPRFEATIDLGGQTIAGPAKSALGVANQDALAFGRPSAGNRRQCGKSIAYAVVADGVSTARAGDGAMASAIASKQLQATLEAATHAANDRAAFEEIIQDSAYRAASEIVALALAAPDLPSDLRESDLMSTTAVVAVCDEETLRVASIGDSRLYLVGRDFIDQLTIDGDVASFQLASGSPPEQVLELGDQGKALRFCVGAATTNEQARFAADVTRCKPQFSHWPLTSGDVVLLCSDGLIDEGVFLDPEDAFHIVRKEAEASAQALAEKLVAAAAERQRLPSPAEPNGFGDNIACIVIKITPAKAPPL